MPVIGLGTAGLPKNSIERVIGVAYDVGYRKIDTAWYYQNEEEIGRTLKKMKIPRENLFITSKLHFNDLFIVNNNKAIPLKTVKQAYEATLKRLQTDFLDLYLIHWPWFNSVSLYEQLCELNISKEVRAIGVSSFEPNHLDSVISQTKITPAINYFEASPYGQRKYLIEYCEKRSIQCEAFLGVPIDLMDVVSYLKDPVIREIAYSHKKTTNQITLRWLFQQGITSIPHTAQKQIIIEDINIFDFSLSDEEMNRINSLDRDEYFRPRKLKK